MTTEVQNYALTSNWLDYTGGDTVSETITTTTICSGCGTGGMMPVGTKPAGASPYGPLDMAGNVTEFVSDCYSPTYYSECASVCDNPQGPATCSRSTYVAHGGYYGFWASNLRTSRRFAFIAGYGFDSYGIRCCR